MNTKDAEKLLMEVVEKNCEYSRKMGPVVLSICTQLNILGLEIREASKANDLYKYRLAPKGEKRILAHFNTIEEIDKYLSDLTNATKGDTQMTL